MLNIQKKLIGYNYSSGNDIKHIVVHDTGNADSGANAMAHYRYFNGGDRQASAHYFVDDSNIVQLIEDSNAAWHCGDGHGAYGITNHNSIGIEICINSDGDYNRAVSNAIDLVKVKMAQYNIPLDRVVRHYDASRKNCPASMSANGWAKWNWFKNQLIGSGAVSNTVEEGAIAYGYVNAQSGLNVREQASADSQRIGGLSNGTEVKIGSESNGWYNIYFGDHGGWVKGEYITITKRVAKKPEATNTGSTDGNVYFRVVCGSYEERSNAEEIQAKLKVAGFDSFLVAFEKDGKAYLRVICDSFKDRKNAENRQAELKAKGFDSFLVAFNK
ncbi:MAG: N-acetylmuramoyl-L-alanine amidase [Clostridium sp.]|nr:N-acetylmuramoyl-L-alanine amidase [Clostridium sp.]